MSEYTVRRSGIAVPANTILKAAGWAQLVDADVAAAANLALSKLAPGASGVVMSNGSAISAGNTIGTTNITSGAVSQMFWANWAAGASQVSSGSWHYYGLNLSATGLTIGSKVALFLITSTSNNTATAILNAGIGIDSVAGPTFTSSAGAAAVGIGTTVAVVGAHTTTASSHAYYSIWNTNAGTISVSGQHMLMAVEMKR